VRSRNAPLPPILERPAQSQRKSREPLLRIAAGEMTATLAYTEESGVGT
jgi:hypothetical protein